MPHEQSEIPARSTQRFGGHSRKKNSWRGKGGQPPERARVKTYYEKRFHKRRWSALGQDEQRASQYHDLASIFPVHRRRLRVAVSLPREHQPTLIHLIDRGRGG